MEPKFVKTEEGLELPNLSIARGLILSYLHPSTYIPK